MLPAASTSPPRPASAWRRSGTADSSPPWAGRMRAHTSGCPDRAGSVGFLVSDTFLPPLAALVLPVAGHHQRSLGQPLGQGFQFTKRAVLSGKVIAGRPVSRPLCLAPLTF